MKNFSSKNIWDAAATVFSCLLFGPWSFTFFRENAVPPSHQVSRLIAAGDIHLNPLNPQSGTIRLGPALAAYRQAALISPEDVGSRWKLAQALLSQHREGHAPKFHKTAEIIALAEELIVLGEEGNLLLAGAYWRMSVLAPDFKQASRWLDLAEFEIDAASRFQQNANSKPGVSSRINVLRDRVSAVRSQIKRRWVSGA